MHFTGDTGYIRLVPSKPDRIGLWYYEAVCYLKNGDPFLIDPRSSDRISAWGKSMPVSAIVKEWGQICTKLNNPRPFLVFDSYYADNTSSQWLNEHNIRLIASVQTQRFQNVMDNMSMHGQPVDKPGHTAAIRKEESKEVFMHHWDMDTNVGEKYVLSNAFERDRE